MKEGYTGVIWNADFYVSQVAKRGRGRPRTWFKPQVESIIAQALFHSVSLRTACKHAGVSYNSFLAAKRKYT